jgi:homoserine dehydrogenase
MSVVRVALLGFGTVGSAVSRRLIESPTHTDNPIALTHILDRRAGEKSAFAPKSAAPIVWTTGIDEILHSDVDIVIEAIGGVEPALDWVRCALAAGKSVVTANKQLVARHGPELWALASRQGRQFRFEAAVGGAMPIVRAIVDGLAGDRLTRLVAILNGTTNAVLSRMEVTSCSLSEALADARARGYAERDPRADLDGDDARAKLAILCALAFGVRVEASDIPACSACSIEAGDFVEARRRRGTIRQLAHADYNRARSRLSAWVGPVFVPGDSVFARATGPQNVAVVTGEHSGEIGIFGAGAGGDATAVAILGDVVSIARDRAAIVPPPRLMSDFTLEASNVRTFQLAGPPSQHLGWGALAGPPSQHLGWGALAGPLARYPGPGALADAMVEAV